MASIIARGSLMGKRPEHCDFGRADRRSETSRKFRLMRTLWVEMLMLSLTVNERFIAADCCRYKVVLGRQIPYSNM